MCQRGDEVSSVLQMVLCQDRRVTVDDLYPRKGRGTALIEVTECSTYIILSLLGMPAGTGNNEDRALVTQPSADGLSTAM